MNSKRTLRLLVPSLFLLVLGVGNLIVGQYKYSQYSELLVELEKQITTEPPKNLSPLQKLQYANQYSPKSVALKNKAGARRDFYTLVSFSGKIFLALSAAFFSVLILNILTKERN